jgi:hypothetical protein
MPDIPDFVSPIDGKVVHGRAGLRVHNKTHNVTNVADFEGEWKRKAEERQRMFSGDRGFDAKRRKEAIIRAVNKHWR